MGDQGDVGLSAAIRDIAAERARQIEDEGWTPEHDDHHAEGKLALAGALYASPIPLFRVDVSHPFAEVAGYEVSEPGILQWSDPWPFKVRRHVRHDLDVMVNDGDKRGEGDRRRNLVKAGALIVAEIERLDRAQGTSHD